MSKSKDSILYCAKCRHKLSCTVPCYPVERLLDSVTVHPTEVSIEYADQIEVSPSEAFVPSLTWTNKSNKRKVFELCIIDGHTQQYAAVVVGCSQPRVATIIKEIMQHIDKL